MADLGSGPTSSEAEELLAIARLGATRAGASGAQRDDVAQAIAESFTGNWGEPHIVRSAEQGCQRMARLHHRHLPTLH